MKFDPGSQECYYGIVQLLETFSGGTVQRCCRIWVGVLLLLLLKMELRLHGLFRFGQHLNGRRPHVPPRSRQALLVTEGGTAATTSGSRSMSVGR